MLALFDEQPADQRERLSGSISLTRGIQILRDAKAPLPSRTSCKLELILARERLYIWIEFSSGRSVVFRVGLIHPLDHYTMLFLVEASNA